MVTEHDAKKAGAEVVKQIDDPCQSGLLYPGLQALDEHYLQVDAQFGGVDQRKIFTYAEKYLPKLNYGKRAHLMNPMVPGLTGGKMSSSEVDSKIDLLDSPNNVRIKLMAAECDASNPDNGVIAFIKHVVFPILRMRKKSFVTKNGREYASTSELISAFVKGEISGNELKLEVISFLNQLLEPIRKEFEKPELQELSQKAYITQKEKINCNLNNVNSNADARSSLSKENLDLICKNLTPSEENVSELLHCSSPNVLWSIFVTEKPSIAILGQISKIRDFVKAGCLVTILVSDIISHLDAAQVPWEIAPCRGQYFLEVIKSALEVYKIPLDRVNFIKGSDYQCSKDYILDLYKLTALVTCNESQKAISSVLKDPTLLSALLVPDMITLDEKYNKANIHFTGSQMFPVFQFAEKYLRLVDSRLVVHLCYEELPSLLNRATLNFEEEFIELLETESTFKKKIKSAFCETGNIAFNPVLALVKLVIMPHLGEEKFTITRAEEHGGSKVFLSYAELEEYFRTGELHPGDLKEAVLQYSKKLLDPLRKAMDTPAFKKLLNGAFPPPPKKTKKPAGKGATTSTNDEFVPSKFDMRVGKIVEVEQHPDADSLYVEKIDLGEGELRTIVSGLVKYVPIDQMRDRMVVVLANLKPQSMRGIKSAGMVLCASVENAVEPLIPASGSNPGDRVFIEGYAGEPDPVLNTKKSDALAKMLSGFKTTASLNASWEGNDMCTSAGPVTVASLKNTPIK